jgi:putative transposase
MMAVVNNFGAECMIFNGHIMKAYNQLANKRISKIVSKQTKGTTEKFVPTDGYYKVLNKRQNSMKDYILKTSKMLIDWCIEQCVDTIVIGHSAFWKDKCPFKDKETQNFVQIPFDSLIKAIRYRCERAGIKLVVKEESYTSKASFLDGDFIPVYNKKLTKEEHKLIDKTFSGYRPHRGIYVSKDGTRINADLNGAANILRKAFPDAFEKGTMPDFRNMRYIVHPDYENRKANQEKQRQAKEIQNAQDFKTLLYFHQR